MGETMELDPKDAWVLIKRGLYWRPNAQGYTGILSQAGLYSDEESAARLDEGVTRQKFSEAAEVSGATFIDIERDYWREECFRLRATAARPAPLPAPVEEGTRATINALSVTTRALEILLKHHGGHIDSLPGAFGVGDLKLARQAIEEGQGALAAALGAALKPAPTPSSSTGSEDVGDWRSLIDDVRADAYVAGAEGRLSETAAAQSSKHLHDTIVDALAAERTLREAAERELVEFEGGENRLWTASNAIVGRVWELLGGQDATRADGQNLIARVGEVVAAREAAVARAEAYRRALSNIAHTFTEETMPAEYYQQIARAAIAAQPTTEGEKP